MRIQTSLCCYELLQQVVEALYLLNLSINKEFNPLGSEFLGYESVNKECHHHRGEGVGKGKR